MTTQLSPREQNVLQTYRRYMITPGKMLCFSGQDLDRHKTALDQLSEKELLEKEGFKGGYSLTPAGYSALKNLPKKSTE